MNIEINGAPILFTLPWFGPINITSTRVNSLLAMAVVCVIG